MDEPKDERMTAISHELQDWLQDKNLTPRQATIVLTISLAEFLGYCVKDRETMDRLLDLVLKDVREGANACRDAKERGHLN